MLVSLLLLGILRRYLLMIVGIRSGGIPLMNIVELNDIVILLMILFEKKTFGGIYVVPVKNMPTT